MAFDWTSLIPGLINAGVGIYGANQQANAAQQAGQQAAQAAQFRPVGITTRFGRTGFQFDPASGRLIGAGYQVAPDIAAMREAALGLGGGAFQQALDAQRAQSMINMAGAGLFNLGQQYIAQTPQQAAMQYMAQQADLLAPMDERAFAQLQNKLYRSGTGGLAIGATGMRPSGAAGLGASNPQMEAYFNAMQQRNAQLAAQAQQEGMRQATFGQGLLGGALNLIGSGYGLQQRAYDPFRTAFGTATDIEQAGGGAPMQQSIALGAGSPAAAQTLYQAGLAQAQRGQANAAALAGLSDPIARLIAGLGKTPSVQYPTGMTYYE